MRVCATAYLLAIHPLTNRSFCGVTTWKVDASLDNKPGRGAIKENGGWGDKRDRELCMAMAGA
jgi:hypothetical protein